MESLDYWASGGPKPDSEAWDRRRPLGHDEGETIIKTRWASEEITVDFADAGLMLLNPNHAYGTVADAIGYVDRLIDAGVDEVLFICQMGTVPFWAQLETVRNIGRHVIPHFRSQYTGR